MLNVGLRPCARELGISHVRLLALANEGRVPRNMDGTFDLDAVRAAFTATKDPSQQSKVRESASAPPAPNAGIGMPHPVDPGFAKIRTALHAVKLKEATLDLQEREAELMATSIVKREVGGMILAAKSRLLGMANKLAPELALESDAATCKAIMEAEILDALAELSEWKPRAA